MSEAEILRKALKSAIAWYGAPMQIPREGRNKYTESLYQYMASEVVEMKKALAAAEAV